MDDAYKRLAYENAQINYRKFEEDYEKFQVLRKGEAVSDNQLRDMLIGFENAAIQLENARKQWEDAKIVSPFSGVIASKKTELGAYVNQGVTYKGSITGISPQGSGSHTFPVEITIANSDKNPLKAGSYVNVSVNMDAQKLRAYNLSVLQVLPSSCLPFRFLSFPH